MALVFFGFFGFFGFFWHRPWPAFEIGNWFLGLFWFFLVFFGFFWFFWFFFGFFWYLNLGLEYHPKKTKKNQKKTKKNQKNPKKPKKTSRYTKIGKLAWFFFGFFLVFLGVSTPPPNLHLAMILFRMKIIINFEKFKKKKYMSPGFEPATFDALIRCRNPHATNLMSWMKLFYISMRASLTSRRLVASRHSLLARKSGIFCSR